MYKIYRILATYLNQILFDNQCFTFLTNFKLVKLFFNDWVIMNEIIKIIFFIFGNFSWNDNILISYTSTDKKVGLGHY